jgi:hypothetical protein
VARRNGVLTGQEQVSSDAVAKDAPVLANPFHCSVENPRTSKECHEFGRRRDFFVAEREVVVENILAVLPDVFRSRTLDLVDPGEVRFQASLFLSVAGEATGKKRRDKGNNGHAFQNTMTTFRAFAHP